MRRDIHSEERCCPAGRNARFIKAARDPTKPFLFILFCSQRGIKARVVFLRFPRYLQPSVAMAMESEVSTALLKMTTYVYRFNLPATKVIKFSKCFGPANLGEEETSKTIRCKLSPVG